MVDATSYRDDDTSILIHFHDPDEDSMPSIRFGPWVFVGLFVVLIIVSGFLVLAILSCSRLQEKVASKQKQGMLNIFKVLLHS